MPKLWLLGLVCLVGSRSMLCQSAPEPARSEVWRQVNENAKRLKSGDLSASRPLAQQLFANIGVPRTLADGIGMTSRVAQAETNYRTGNIAGTTEPDVVKAVNHFMKTVGGPEWASTNAKEVKKMRMRLLVLYPQLMASQAPADRNGNYKALDDTMSPLEASYVAAGLIYQKVFNEDFQLSDAEKATSDETERKRLHAGRTKNMLPLTRGNQVGDNTRSIVAAADTFLTELHIEPSSVSTAVAYVARPLAGGSR